MTDSKVETTKFSVEEQEKYEKFCLEKISEIQKELEDEKLWKVSKTVATNRIQRKFNIQLFRRDFEGKFRMYKAEGIFENLLMDDYYAYEVLEANKEGFDMKTRDKRIKFYNTIEKYKENFFLLHHAGKTGTKLVKDREFLCMYYIKKDENEIFQITHSVKEEDDQKVPLEDLERNKRAKIINGLYIKKIDDKKIKITFFNFVNARGKITPALLNGNLASSSVDILKRARIHFAKK